MTAGAEGRGCWSSTGHSTPRLHNRMRRQCAPAGSAFLALASQAKDDARGSRMDTLAASTLSRPLAKAPAPLAVYSRRLSRQSSVLSLH